MFFAAINARNLATLLKNAKMKKLVLSVPITIILNHVLILEMILLYLKNITNIKQYLHGNDKIEVVGLDGGHFYDLAILAKVKNCWNGDGTKCETMSKSKIVFLGKVISRFKR